ncbi:hypothetical protein EVAR_62930_1 [Eumeta japonica]|uniref:Uncharacterized protein n=1 Tax=Eumeta variegata TaxID=151549 RepID=A0A4C2AGK5_EUMVA|nr:hypothetical protein EVAR_62930_1 [Eumeta japonica]
MALESKTELEKLTNINKTVKEAVVSKLSAIRELALRIEESRSRNAAELKREKATRAQDISALERQQRQNTELQLNKCLDLASKMDDIKKRGSVNAKRSRLL